MNRQNITLTAKIIAQDTEELYDIARSKGIIMPHPALGIFKSILAEVEKPNANKIRLGTKATDAAVSTLVGTQINKNHLRTDNVLGHTIDALINKDKEIEIVSIFFKDIYEDEWAEAQKLFSKNELTMSFELSADVESQDVLADGTKRLNDYYFTGAGLLFGVKPACKKARVFEIATRKLTDKLTMERQSLIFANNQNSQKSIMEVLKLMADEVKKIEEIQAADVIVETPVVTEPIKIEEVAKVEETIVVPDVAKVEDAQKLCPECNEPMDDDKCAKCNTKKATEEVKVEEPISEVVAEVVPPPTVVVTEITQKVTDTMSQNSETVKVETETTRSVDNQEKEHRVEMVEVTYTYAQVEELKAEYEKTVAELKEQIVAKDAEIVVIKATSEKLATRKIELASNEFVKDFTDSDYLDDVKVENAKLKSDAAKQEKVIAEAKPILATGHKKVDASSEESGSPIGKLLKSRRIARK
jgi:hypothetical protein